MSDTRVSVSLNPERTALILFASIGVLLIGSLVTQVGYRIYGYDYIMGVVPLLYVDREANLPTWFSSTLLLAASVVLWSIAHDRKKGGLGRTGHWYALALIFLALAIDEAASIHELLTTPVRQAMGTGGILYYAWIIPGGVFVLGVFLSYLGFLRRLPAPIRLGVLAAGGLYVGGALGVEMVGGYYESTVGTKSTMGYSLITHVEEGLEMVGAATFISVLLMYRRDYLDPAVGDLAAGSAGGVAAGTANVERNQPDD